MCKCWSLDGPKLFLCCNESCTVGLVPFLCSMKDSTAVCSLRSAPLVMAQHTIWVVFGNRATLGGFSGMVTILKWCPFCLPSRQPPTRWSRLRLVTVVTLAAPPSGALYLMTWRILLHTRTHTHAHWHSHTQTHYSICLLTLDPSHREGTHERNVCCWFWECSHACWAGWVRWIFWQDCLKGCQIMTRWLNVSLGPLTSNYIEYEE